MKVESPDLALDGRPAVSMLELYTSVWRFAAGGRASVGSQTIKLLVPWLTAQAIERVQYAVDGEAAAGVRHLGSISTLIPQESEIFEATLRDNLTFGAAYSEEQIERAARLSALDAVAASPPQKWDMPLSERGSTFPGATPTACAGARAARWGTQFGAAAR